MPGQLCLATQNSKTRFGGFSFVTHLLVTLSRNMSSCTSKNNVTVIAFYPGGGGNRYLLSLLNREYSTPGITYDEQFVNQRTSFRYLFTEISEELPEYCLTHCMNATQIEKVLKPKNIVFINTNLQQSLQREWYHDGVRLHNKNHTTSMSHSDQVVQAYQGIKDLTWPVVSSIEEFNELSERIRVEVIETMQKNTASTDLESAWETISWHCQYYSKYPAEFKDYRVVSLTENSPFAKVMQEELASYRSDLFNFCWNTYATKGSNAPIIDLYARHKVLLATQMSDVHNETRLGRGRSA